MTENEVEEKKEEIVNKEEEILTIKVVLLGETAVGKSSLIARFVNDTFSQNFVPTMAGCYSSKIQEYVEDKKKLKFEIWDTAGQERYRSITKIFYKDASVAILVYDITRKDTFQEIKNYWYKEVRDNSNENIVIAIAGNKIDCYEYEEVNKNEVQEFSDQIGAIYKGTSAKSGNGVEDLFHKIGLKIIDPVNYLERVNNSKNARIKNKKSILISSEIQNEEKKDEDYLVKNNNVNNDDKNKKNKKKSNCC